MKNSETKFTLLTEYYAVRLKDELGHIIISNTTELIIQ